MIEYEGFQCVALVLVFQEKGLEVSGLIGRSYLG